ncbi:putative NEDD4-binding protein 2 [Glarea lozoyensis 74030]|uniref:Putative NEDD4-binding protein 2 n=1 Tax=Glarea lozoyensis (strain ATCC 74030 / MF5533) TaxID=1104152 RepID=H0EHG9_GLAL7|nr:putative NEDD4-binding protein 2 [Glarea lozoyensis 74030]
MLRSILGPARSDDEIEAALALHGYDLSATINAFIEGQGSDASTVPVQTIESKTAAILIGKSMTADIPRPVTPAGQQRSGVVCRFWLSTGQCLRADCRFSHDLSNHICNAAQAWNRNDARAAKALSLRGQSENDLMRKAHREAARELYEERNKNSSSSAELYVDLHGLHPEEAVEYLERVLLENQKEVKPVYAITGTGHHSKNGKDKVGKAIRNFLNEWRYAYREFSVPGDRNNVGGILGIDARSWDKSLVRDGQPTVEVEKEEVDILTQGHTIGQGKMKLLVRDQPSKAR